MTFIPKRNGHMADMMIVQDIYLHLVDTAMSGITTTYREIGGHLLLKRAKREGNTVEFPNSFIGNFSNRSIRITLDEADGSPEESARFMAEEAASLAGKSEVDVALDSIAEWCRTKGLPPLTALVVRDSGGSAGQAGAGFWKSLGYPEDFIDSGDERAALWVLQRQCHEYYQGIGINNPDLREYVFGREMALMNDRGHPKITEMIEYGTLLRARRAVRQRIISRNGMSMREPVDMFVAMKRWLDHHYPEKK